MLRLAPLLNGCDMTFFHDIRYAFRSLARTPGVTLVAALSLALGIGLISTVFSFMDGMWLRPLPGVRDPDRLPGCSPPASAIAWARFPGATMSTLPLPPNLSAASSPFSAAARSLPWARASIRP